MDLKAIAQEVETPSLLDSAINRHQGNNVKSPSLVRGGSYIIRHWSIKALEGDNPHQIATFLGAGKSVDALYEQTPRAKDMAPDERYFFKRVLNDVILEAQNNNGALMLNNDPEQRITFFAILGQPNMQAAKPQAPAARAPRAERSTSITQTVPLTRTPRRAKDPEVQIPTNSEELSALFAKRQAPDLVEYYTVVLATEQQARALAELYSGDGAQYVKDGVQNTARIPVSYDNLNGFASKAKELGATESFLHRALK